MSNEFHIDGPPGTGKTTYLAKQIERAAEKHGSENVIVASYTKAAATELNRRALPIPRENIGTLHALCYRALKDRYEIAETKAQEFNDQNPGAEISVSSKSSPMTEMAVDAVFQTNGDKFLNAYNLARAKCQDLSTMPRNVIEWVKKWESWKMKSSYIDFTDMISFVSMMDEPFPGNPVIGIYDEIQDCNKLQIRLIRKWAKYQEQVLLAGDSDQCIYDWAGADPQVFSHALIPESNKRILAQSWRLPRRVHEYSQAWIKQIKNREPKEFKPRDIEGFVTRSDATYRTPQSVIEMAGRYAQDGKSVMILATCGFHLNIIKQYLREAGLTYWNPYRLARGDWNPMGNFHRGSSTRISTRERILSFLDESCGLPNKDYWTIENLSRWAELVTVKGVFKRGGKDRIAQLIDGESEGFLQTETDDEFYKNIFEGPALERALQRDVQWFKQSLLSAKRSAVEYPLSVYSKQGRKALEERPKIVLGTVHCSPGDEPILTTEGEVQIKDLNPKIHRLASYMSKCNRLAWGGRNSKTGSPRKNMGYPFIIAKNPYNGNMITLETDFSKTRVTPNHRIQVKFNKKFFEKWVVYLMKRGDWWRVGICVSGHRPYKSGGIAGRLATEQADCAWILKVCCSREEAIYHESIIQGKFGIPGLTFEAAKNRSLSSEVLHKIHEKTKFAVNQRIDHLFNIYEIIKHEPLWTRQTKVIQKRNMRGMFLTVAANILDGYMEILIPEKSFTENRYGLKFNVKPIWKTVSVFKEHFVGDVYSLEVLPHHHYVSGGAIVHNSVKGGEADVCILFPDLSIAAMEEYKRTPDSVIRTFYVGMTRAKEGLILCKANSNMCAKFN